MNVGELKGLLDGLRDDTLIGITVDEDAFSVGEIIAERGRLTKTEYLTLVAFDSYEHNRYLTIGDLKRTTEKCPDDALVFVETGVPLIVDEFRNGNFYVNG